MLWKHREVEDSIQKTEYRRKIFITKKRNQANMAPKIGLIGFIGSNQPN